MPVLKYVKPRFFSFFFYPIPFVIIDFGYSFLAPVKFTHVVMTV